MLISNPIIFKHVPKLRWGLRLLALAVFLLAIAYPWTLDWALRQVLRRQGIKVRRARRGSACAMPPLWWPLRLEYGYNLNPRKADLVGALHFSIGFPF